MFEPRPSSIQLQHLVPELGSLWSATCALRSRAPARPKLRQTARGRAKPASGARASSARSDIETHPLGIDKNRIAQLNFDVAAAIRDAHDGRYDLEGRNVSGPPPKPLEPYVVHVEGDDIIVEKATP